MDSNRHNKSNETQDSDDLIAQLARLVAQDARETSSQSDAYTRTEPSFAPEPEPEGQPEPEQAVEDDQFWPEDAPTYGASDEDAFVEDQEPPATEAYYDSEPVREDESADPIAGLIADAEVEAYTRDTGEEQWEDFSSDPVPAQSQPSYAEPAQSSQTWVEPEQDYTAEQTTDRDPLSEIEALIGEAARANADNSISGRRVRSSFLDDGPTSSAVDAAESAIMAAAAATGSPVRRYEPDADTPTHEDEDAYEEVETDYAANEQQNFERVPDPLFASNAAASAEYDRREPEMESDDEEYYDETEESAARPRRGLPGFVLPVAAGVVLVGLLGGAYAMFFTGAPVPGEAPVLTADASPLKEEGAEPVATGNESVVFNEIEGNTAAVEDETLVSRDQTGGATGNEVASVIGAEEGEMALANRPVRTVTVRPDGTIVQAEDSVAGSNVLPVDRPDVPAVPNSTLTSDPIGAAIAEAMAGETALAPAPTDTATIAVAETSDTPATATTATDATGTTTPLPIPRPTTLAATETAPAAPAATPAATDAPAAVASTEAATAPTPAATTPSGTVGAWVQLASQRTEADAQADIPSLQARFGSLFNGATPEVSQVDLGERGIYYRVRLPQPTFAQANSVCTAIQGQGGDCFVLNN